MNKKQMTNYLKFVYIALRQKCVSNGVGSLFILIRMRTVKQQSLTKIPTPVFLSGKALSPMKEFLKQQPI